MEPAKVGMLIKLGLIPKDAELIDASLMWGRLISDPVLWEKRQGDCLLPVLEKLTPVEVVALRQRLEAAEKAKH